MVRAAMVLLDNMNIKRRYKLGRILSSSRGSYTPYDALLDAEAGRVIALNPSAMAVVPVEPDDHDVSGILPAKAVAQHFARGSLAGEMSIGANGSVVISQNGARSEYRRESDGTRPVPESWTTVIPPKRDSDTVVCLDAELLRRLADAIGAANLEERRSANGFDTAIVRLRIPNTGEAIRVETMHNDSAFGLIMPVGG